MSLDDFMAAQNWGALKVAAGWEVRRDGDVVLLTLPARDEESYLLRLVCDGYPVTPPSVAFVDAAGNKLNPLAWPKGNQRFFEIVKPPPHCWLCTNLTREGLHHHREWLTDASKNPWSGDRHTLLDVFNLVQRLLRSEDYSGRGP